MMRSLSIAATGMIAQENKMNVVAHNLANASTTGFKRQRAEFADLVAEQVGAGGRPSAVENGLGVRVGATTRTLTAGDLLTTNNPLDLAIEGQGFLQVEMPDGDIGYTRAGNLRVDGDGRLVAQNGWPLEPRIEVPPDALSVAVDRDGRVTARVPGKELPTELGKIELAVFTNPGGLEALGDTMLRATEASGRPQVVTPGEEGSGNLLQGMLEGANVKTVEEMIDLITTQRAYEMTSKVIQSADQMLQRLAQLR
jgi:flagellar basal-body rod protein FlgG